LHTFAHVTLLALIVLNPLAAIAAPQALPPIPEWPIIGPILQWLGIVEASPAAATINPALPEYRVGNLEEAEALWERINPNESIRVVITDEDANAFIQRLTREDESIQSLTVAFESGAAVLRVTLSRDLLSEFDIQMPFFIRGDALEIKLTVNATATDCKPVVTVKSLDFNGWPLPIKGLVAETLNALINEEWPANICLEQVIFSSGELALEGHRR